ncbi:MAG: hypothetical protein ABJA84_04790 [Polaromonas sp.]
MPEMPWQHQKVRILASVEQAFQSNAAKQFILVNLDGRFSQGGPIKSCASKSAEDS